MKIIDLKCSECGHDDFEVDDPKHELTCLRCRAIYQWEFWEYVEDDAQASSTKFLQDQ